MSNSGLPKSQKVTLGPILHHFLRHQGVPSNVLKIAEEPHLLLHPLNIAGGSPRSSPKGVWSPGRQALSLGHSASRVCSSGAGAPLWFHMWLLSPSCTICAWWMMRGCSPGL